MKDVVVAVRSSPLTTSRVHEALRMALGMTLSNHRVTVVYVGEGAGGAVALNGTTLHRPDLAESLDLLDACKIREVVETEALVSSYGVVRPRVERLNRTQLLEILDAADVVIPW